MSKAVPSLQDILQQNNSNIFSATKGKLDPSKDLFVSGFSYSQSAMLQALYSCIADTPNQLFSRTATDEGFLAAIAFDETSNRIKRKDPEFSNGEVLVTSLAEVDVPANSQFITEDGEVYVSTILRTTQPQSFLIQSLERVDNVAYATIPDHNLGNLMELTISGATQTDFNGLQEITIVSKDVVKYPNEGANQVATGTISAAFFGNRVPVQSLLPNANANKDFNNAIQVASSLDLTNSYITYNGITGGKNIESLASFKSRIISFLQNPQNPGNIYQHVSWVLQNTDANYCYFFNSEDALYLYLTAVVSKMKDDYLFEDFSNDELSNMKLKFIDNNQFCLSGVSALQLSFSNSTRVNINISINGLSPNIVSMKAAINKKLKEYIALLPIKFYLQSSQLSADTLSSIARSARDISGATPSITSVSVSGAGSLDANTKKPILGTVTYA